ncbi:hypothetical protein [Rubripirellula tenax]|nr:hypothetical protein [Rubripirellula tenax]
MTFHSDVAANAIIKAGDANIEIDRLKGLIVRCYSALHSGVWKDGETDAELAAFINDQMSSKYGNEWSR